MWKQLLFCLFCSPPIFTFAYSYHESGHDRWYQPVVRRPVDVVTDVVNNLGVRILQQYTGHGNVAFSPTGVGFVLAALYEGSAGRGSAQIENALGLPRDRDITRIGFRDIHRRLRTYLNADGFLGGLTLSKANTALRPEYEDILRFYGFDLSTGEQEMNTTMPPNSAPNVDTVPKEDQKGNEGSDGNGENSSTNGNNGNSPSNGNSDDSDNPETLATTEQAESLTTSAVEILETTMNTGPSARLTQTSTGTPIPSSQLTETANFETTPQSTAPAETTPNLISSTISREATTVASLTMADRRKETTTRIVETTLGSLESQNENGMSTVSPQSSTGSMESAGSTESVEGTGSTESTLNVGSTQSALNAGSTQSILSAGSEQSTLNTGSTQSTLNAGSTQNTINMGSTQSSINTESTLNTGSAQSTISTGSGQSTLNTGSAQGTLSTGSTQNTLDTGSTESTLNTGSTQNILNTGSTQSTLNAASTQSISSTGSTESASGSTESSLNTASTESTFSTTNSGPETTTDGTSTTTPTESAGTDADMDFTDGSTFAIDNVETTTRSGPEVFTESDGVDGSTVSMDASTDFTTATTDGSEFSGDATTASVSTSMDDSTNRIRKRSVRSPRGYFSSYPDEGIWMQDLGIWKAYPTSTGEASVRDSTEISFLVNGCDVSSVSATRYIAVLPFAYFPSLHAVALEFPLDDPRYNVLLLMPTDRSDTHRLARDLDGKSLRLLRKQLQPTWVRATIPSFMLRGFVTLTPFLQRLGVVDVFEPRVADLSPMTTDLGVYARDVQQSIGVNIRNYMKPDRTHSRNGLFERAGPVPFTALHPFLYFIIDAETSVTLIAGRVEDPLNSRIL